MMNPDDKAELDRILAGADYIKGSDANEEPGPLPELLGAVKTRTIDAVSVQGMASATCTRTCVYVHVCTRMCNSYVQAQTLISVFELNRTCDTDLIPIHMNR